MFSHELSKALFEIEELKARLATVEGERDAARADAVDMQSLFDLQRRRMVVADELWRKAHPEEGMTWPDLGRLLEWLMEQTTTAQSGEARAVEALRNLRLPLAQLGDFIYSPVRDASQELLSIVNSVLTDVETNPAVSWLAQQRAEAAAEALEHLRTRWLTDPNYSVGQQEIWRCAREYAAALRAGATGGADD
jgi:hypothetical protein